MSEPTVLRLNAALLIATALVLALAAATTVWVRAETARLTAPVEHPTTTATR